MLKLVVVNVYSNKIVMHCTGTFFFFFLHLQSDPELLAHLVKIVKKGNETVIVVNYFIRGL